MSHPVVGSGFAPSARPGMTIVALEITPIGGLATYPRPLRLAASM